MQSFFKGCIILAMTGLCLSLSAQKKEPTYQKWYSEAVILEQSAIYDLAKKYYYDALWAVPDARNARDIRNQIKAKIQLMECYLRYYHLWEQGGQLEELQDFESAFKYYDDALQYAEYEQLVIPNTDSLRSRTQVVAQTAELCKSLCLIETLNLEGDYGQARNLYHQWVQQAENYGYKWAKYYFPNDFVQKMDSITRFLEDDRNVILSYRAVFPEEYVVMDDYLFQLLDITACQNPHPVESDVTFVFLLDTNGVLKHYIVGDQIDDDLNTSLLAEAANMRLLQPYRYGFSLPAKEELRYHVSSNRSEVWVQKTKKELKLKDSQWKQQYLEEFGTQLTSAPQGKYLFIIYQNIIDDNALSYVRLTQAKGGKAKKWLKAR